MNLVENRIIRRIASGVLSATSLIATAAIPASSNAHEIQPAPLTETQKQSSPIYRTAILIDDIDTSLSVDRFRQTRYTSENFGPLVEYLSPTGVWPPRFEGTVLFYSYQGGATTFLGAGNSIYDPNPYEAIHTHQPIERSVEMLKDMIEERHSEEEASKNSGFFRGLTTEKYDLFGYGFGGLVAEQYLLNHVLSANGIHHNGVINSATLLYDGDKPQTGRTLATEDIDLLSGTLDIKIVTMTNIGRRQILEAPAEIGQILIG